jgi:hypothetical protein
MGHGFIPYRKTFLTQRSQRRKGRKENTLMPVLSQLYGIAGVIIIVIWNSLAIFASLRPLR